MSPRLLALPGPSALLEPLATLPLPIPCKLGATSSCSPRQCFDLPLAAGTGTDFRPPSSPSDGVPGGSPVNGKNSGTNRSVSAARGVLGAWMKKLPWPAVSGAAVALPLLPLKANSPGLVRLWSPPLSWTHRRRGSQTPSQAPSSHACQTCSGRAWPASIASRARARGGGCGPCHPEFQPRQCSWANWLARRSPT